MEHYYLVSFAVVLIVAAGKSQRTKRFREPFSPLRDERANATVFPGSAAAAIWPIFDVSPKRPISRRTYTPSLDIH
jgi:hypothetical protein